MIELKNKKCVPCSGDIPPFTQTQIDSHLKLVKNWSVDQNDKGGFFLTKKLKFNDFKKSFKFIIEISKIAEEENHHPDLKFGWGYAEVVIFTHAINGLTESDFVLAAKINEINV